MILLHTTRNIQKNNIHLINWSSMGEHFGNKKNILVIIGFIYFYIMQLKIKSIPHCTHEHEFSINILSIKKFI
jgi:transketolase N-terminal domain/subunit